MDCVARDLKDHLAPTPCHGQGMFWLSFLEKECISCALRSLWPESEHKDLLPQNFGGLISEAHSWCALKALYKCTQPFPLVLAYFSYRYQFILLIQ